MSRPEDRLRVLETMIAELEARVETALAEFTKAQVERDPLLKFKENELIELQTELNALKMRRPV